MAYYPAEVKQHTLNVLACNAFVGKVRLAKWFTTLPPKTKAKIVKDVTQLVLARRTRMCNFLEYKGRSVFTHLSLTSLSHSLSYGP